ncbi:hypothetical protein P153DRAFT_431812 [Dothidotthia symphoricarpi CBS 119687]|uniref:Aminoglycoside phosphotransferase domain-containing protein n=1 Tax=Dothidotthia symphoricarpi CBS 119687 TaxID=1392245 RepID=A0A6A6ABP8_9PLEO|nr:uncharacterized protein P153DRAFT_431812 [Dothidotthia symphoricarpi CBS 119687]KAF2128996.1 hypothetical protein P153DRAFT_431812 [Dothidotthia symphoricarpi CBS 119687]
MPTHRMQRARTKNAPVKVFVPPNTHISFLPSGKVGLFLPHDIENQTEYQPKMSDRDCQPGNMVELEDVLSPPLPTPDALSHHTPPSDDDDNDDDDDDDDNDTSSTTSTTSTTQWAHEPFTTFHPRVLSLAHTLWPLAPPSSITIERMQGGGYNRIIGIAIPSLGVNCVLRIPRMDAARLDRDVAALRYVGDMGGVPVPRVVGFDGGRENEVGERFMVITRLEGGSLLGEWGGLGGEGRRRVAEDLGRVLRRLMDVTSSTAGWLCLPSNDNDNANDIDNASRDEVIIEPFFEWEGSPQRQDKPPPTIRKLLETNFQDRKDDGLINLPADVLRPKFMDQFIVMASELEEDGWFADNEISLCHLDLEPRNILCGTTPDCPTPHITAVLDWDDAVLAPTFMSCTPPTWIWAWDDDEDDNELRANDMPATEEDGILKRAFEDAAGPKYLRYAYEPAYRLARRLVQFAIDGMKYSHDITEAEEMLREWKEIRRVRREARGDGVDGRHPLGHVFPFLNEDRAGMRHPLGHVFPFLNGCSA